MRPRKMGTVVAATLLGLVASLAWALPASAHAAYKQSRPADGSTESSAPSEVWAEFTEPLAEGSYLQVTDPCGRRVDNGDVTLFGQEMTVSMSGAAAGRYVVAFKAFSQLDPHVTTGDFDFEVASGDPCPGAASEPEPSDDRPSEQNGGAGSTGDGPSGTAASGQPVSNDDGSSVAKDGTEAGAGREANRGSRRPARDRRPGRGDAEPGLPLVSAQDSEDEAPKQPRVWDGIPMGAFLSGLALAALIGAGGGKIYAGIMGPRA